MSNSRKFAIVFAIATLISLTGCPETEVTFTDLTAEINDGSGEVVPSQAMQNVNNAAREKLKELADAGTPVKTREEYDAIRAEIAKTELATVKTSDLTRDDIVDLAELLDLADKDDLTIALYDRLASGSDIAARKANQQIMRKLIVDKNFEELEATLAKFQEKFKPDPDDLSGSFSAVMTLAEHFSESGDADKAYKLITAEINSLPKDAPYASFNLLRYAADIFEEVEKTDELLNIMEEIKTNFDQIIEIRKTEVPEDETEKAVYDKLTRQFERMARGFGNAIQQTRLVGQPAIDFNLSNFFNTEPTSLADLKGKVIMVDFWANWCGPCKRAFPSMKDLYETYSDKGFVIIGVTSLQGKFSDGDIREQNLEPAKELELTADFIKRHQMTWPVAFSDRGCFDPEYGVSGIPTFAVIDRKGIIRKIQVGASQKSEEMLKKLVPELLAESE